MTVSIDFTNMMDAAVQNGVTAEQWASAGRYFPAAHSAVKELRSAGKIGFLDLEPDDQLLQQSLDYAQSARDRFDDVIVLGIGGSALGPIALRTALRPVGWNSLGAAERGGFPRLHVLDNIDPGTIAAVLARLDLSRSLFIVTSKSGGTAETMSQFLVVHERLTSASLDVREHIVFVTDPTRGALRPLAQANGITALEIPANIGGRFSVLTPVGTLPAALIGIDVRALLTGAAEMAQRCDARDLASNPGAVFAMLQWLSDTRHGRTIAVLMPYSDPLRDFAAWFVQLWAESLGKTRLDGSTVGQTPLAALGATDQHSQVQLFMEGPPDKTVSFISVKERPSDLVMPSIFRDVTELGYLGGHSLGELIDIEQRATAGALAARGRPNLTIHVDRVDAWHVGALMQLFEAATAYAGQLYGVNAFDQPGVELGKQFAYGLLGRPGSESARQEWETLPRPDPRSTV